MRRHFGTILICATVIVLAVVISFTIIAVAGVNEGGGGSSSSDPGESVDSITIVGRNVAFDIEQFAVRSGEEITVTFDNRDDGLEHNIAFSDIEGAATELERGSVTQELTFTAPAPGEYEYICDAHPAQMSGTLFVR